MMDFLFDVGNEGLQFLVVQRLDFLDAAKELGEDPLIGSQAFFPGNIVHVFESDLDFSPDGEVCIIVFEVEFSLGHHETIMLSFFEFVDLLQYAVDIAFHFRKGHGKGVDGAFQALQKVHAHEAANPHFAAELREALMVAFCTLFIAIPPRGLDVVRWDINGQVQLVQFLINGLIGDRTGKVCQLCLDGYGLPPVREIADLFSVVVFADVVS